jgi:hypothetical protein
MLVLEKTLNIWLIDETKGKSVIATLYQSVGLLRICLKGLWTSLFLLNC